MAGYRLYYLDIDGHIMAAAESEFTSDDDARAWAVTQIDERDTELWRGAQVVEKFKGADAQR